jgi:hypothetical protein
MSHLSMDSCEGSDELYDTFVQLLDMDETDEMEETDDTTDDDFDDISRGWADGLFGDGEDLSER